MLLSLLGCTTIKDFMRGMEADEYLLRGQKLLAQKDYEGALRDYQKVLSMSAQRSQKAEALFHTGLIHAHFGYSKRNYEKSAAFFVRILNDYPESPLVEQARVLMGVLQEGERLNRIIEKSKPAAKEAEKPSKPVTRTEESGLAREYLLRGQKLLARGDYEGSVHENQKILSMPAHRPPEDEALLNLSLIYAHPGNPKKDYGKALDFLKRLVRDHPGSPLVGQARIWMEVLKEHEDLTGVIQKLKQVDIEVEEKKREKAK